VPKAQAQNELDSILSPINSRSEAPSSQTKWGDFVKNLYLPFYRRKWKRSTRLTNEDRLRVHLTPAFECRSLGSFNRDGLQSYLDEKAGAGLSYSTVAHLRWDLRQIFRMAVSEGYLVRNPAELLFVPREAPRPEHTAMTLEEVQLCFSVLDQRERLIVKLAILAGMRPGEIFGLTWGQVKENHVHITQQIYRGEVDTPKTSNSVRKAALAQGLVEDIREWRETSFNTSSDAWVFPSEKVKTPLDRANLWRRHVGPRLETVGLG